MGGGPDAKAEHLLITLPFPEPTTIIERIKKNHPNIKVTFRNLSAANPFAKDQGIPDGRAYYAGILLLVS